MFFDQMTCNNQLYVLDFLTYSAADYSTFGMIMPGRQFSSNSYRYGFNGMEKDDEIKGSGNSLDFGARMLDTRLGRWFAVDPLAVKYPSLSSYNFVANNPIIFIDPDGKKIVIVTEKGQQITYHKGKLLNAKGQPFTGTSQYLADVKNAIEKIKSGGGEGTRLIESLDTRPEEIRIQFGADNSQRAGLVSFNNKKQNMIPTVKGVQKTDQYVSLAHELAHAEDHYDDITKKELGKSMTDAWVPGVNPGDKPIAREGEKYATHIENKIRSENGLPLRSHYAVSSSGNSGYAPTSILNQDGSSKFFTEEVEITLPTNNGSGLSGDGKPRSETYTVERPVEYD